MAQLVKNPPAIWETWVQSQGWEDPLEKGIAAHSSILAWRIPWTEEPGGPQSMGSQKLHTTEKRTQDKRNFTSHFHINQIVSHIFIFPPTRFPILTYFT